MTTNELVRDDSAVSVQGMPLRAGGIGSSSTTIDVSAAKFIAFDSEVTIQINGEGETFTVPAGSRWTIGNDVTSITLGSATKYMLA